MALFQRAIARDDYLALDADAERPLELLDGAVYERDGESPRHNAIVGNLVVGLREGCSGHVFAQAQRVRIDATGSYVYPDVVIVCDQPRFDTAERPATLVNPRAIVEVLSEPTIDHDLGAKLAHYRQVPSLHEVLFVHTETRAVTLVTREDDGWRLVDRGPDGEVALAGVTLPLELVYEGAESLPA